MANNGMQLTALRAADEAERSTAIYTHLEGEAVKPEEKKGFMRRKGLRAIKEFIVDAATFGAAAATSGVAAGLATVLLWRAGRATAAAITCRQCDACVGEQLLPAGSGTLLFREKCGWCGDTVGCKINVVGAVSDAVAGLEATEALEVVPSG